MGKSRGRKSRQGKPEVEEVIVGGGDEEYDSDECMDMEENGGDVSDDDFGLGEELGGDDGEDGVESEEDEDVDEEDEDEEDEDVDGDGGDGDESQGARGRIVSSGMVKGWSEVLQHKHSLKALRQVVDALAAAIHHTAELKVTQKYHYFVESPQVFNALVRCCLRHVHTVVCHHVPVDGSAKGSKAAKKKSSPTSNPNWSRLRKVVKAYGLNLLLMLEHLHQPTLTCAVLRQAQSLLIHLSCFPRLLRLLTKRLTVLWSSGDEHVRVLSFLCLRQLVITNNNATFKENCFKQMYLSFTRNSAFTNISTLPGIQFMQNSLTEIYSLDLPMTYQHGFVYIRQLAIHLRKAMTEKSKSNLQAVYNWQFVHSICLWCRVLADCASSVLEPLIFPLVQVVIGTVRLLPTARYFPLRFHCLRALNRLSSKTDVYIPVSSHLLEVLESSSVHSRTKGSVAKPPNFAVLLKVSKTQLRTRVYQDGLIDNVFDLLMEHLASYSHHIAFAELVLPVTLKLKQFCKKSKVPKFQQLMRQLVSKVEETSSAIVAARSTVSFSPRDAAEVASWMNQRRQDGTALQKFYSSWKELNDRQKTSAKLNDSYGDNDDGDGDDVDVDTDDDGSSDGGDDDDGISDKAVGRKRRHGSNGEGQKKRKKRRKGKAAAR